MSHLIRREQRRQSRSAASLGGLRPPPQLRRLARVVSREGEGEVGASLSVCGDGQWSHVYTGERL